VKIDPDFERNVVSELHRVLTKGAGDLPESVEKLIDDSESLIISLLRQREIMRHAIYQLFHHELVPGGIIARRAYQLLQDIPANSPGTGDFAGAARTIRKNQTE
jgi:hypothetical protein